MKGNKTTLAQQFVNLLGKDIKNIVVAKIIKLPKEAEDVGFDQ